MHETKNLQDGNFGELKIKNLVLSIIIIYTQLNGFSKSM